MHCEPALQLPGNPKNKGDKSKSPMVILHQSVLAGFALDLQLLAEESQDVQDDQT